MKKTVALIMVILMVLAFAACSEQPQSDSGDTGQATEQNGDGDSEQGDTAQTEDSTDSLAGTKLTVMASQNWINDTDQALTELFEEETGIKVDLQSAPDDQYLNILMSKLATGEGPDIFFARCGAGVSDYLPDQYMLDLSDQPFIEKCEDWAIKSTTYNGRIVGLNYWAGGGGWAITYNKQLFEQYGVSVPKTYEEFKQVCQTFVDNGVRPVFHNSADTWHDMMWLNALAGLVAQEEPDYIEKFKSGEIKFADFEVLEQGLEQLLECVELGYFGDTYLSDTWDLSYEAMGTGKAAMINTYASYTNEIIASYPDSQADTWGSFVVPFCDNTAMAVQAGGLFQAINKDTKNIAAAVEYFNFLTRTDVAEQFYAGHPELAGMSPLKDITLPSTAALDDQLSATGGQYTDFQTGITYFDEVTVSKIIQGMYTGGMTAKEVLEAIDEYRMDMIEAE